MGISFGIHRLRPAPPSPSLPTAQPRANAMAIYSWRESIRQGGVLKVFQTESFTGSTWVTELEPSIKILNALLKKPGIKLKFETTATKADAQVLLSIKAGHGLHAENELGLKGTSMMDSAHIFLPANPTINATKDGTSIGGPVKRHILVHELIHAVGLTNSEHADDGGVFVKNLIITIGTKHGKQQAADGSDSVPDIKLANSTVRALRQAWPK